MREFQFSGKGWVSFRHLFFLLIFICFVAGNNIISAQAVKANRPVLVTCQWLDENRSDPDIVILHISTIIRSYDQGHIPGARFLWPGWIIVSTEKESVVPPEMKKIKDVLEKLGLTDKTHIVLCGSDNNLVTVSRIFVTLSHFGLENRMSVLQGGFDEWKKTGREVTTKQPEFKKGKLLLKMQDNLVDADWMIRNLRNKSFCIIDARPKASYDGSQGSPRRGHIPGAKNLPIAELYNGNFFSEEKISELFGNIGISHDVRPVFYCFIGSSASVDYVAAIVAGYKPLLYDGSMEEWGNRPDLPVESIPDAPDR